MESVSNTLQQNLEVRIMPLTLYFGVKWTNLFWKRSNLNFYLIFKIRCWNTEAKRHRNQKSLHSATLLSTQQNRFLYFISKKNKKLVVMPHIDKAWHECYIWEKNSYFHNTGPEKDFTYITVTHATHLVYETRKIL